MLNIPFTLIDWNMVDASAQAGLQGTVKSQSVHFPGLRIRIVQYDQGYLADHWCQKGHIVHCLEGEVVSEQENGEKFLLKKGMTYIVSDNMSSHRSRAEQKVILLIVDGDFLKSAQAF
jgi:mannose-6-phosphate isomerase class I